MRALSPPDVPAVRQLDARGHDVQPALRAVPLLHAADPLVLERLDEAHDLVARLAGVEHAGEAPQPREGGQAVEEALRQAAHARAVLGHVDQSGRLGQPQPDPLVDVGGAQDLPWRRRSSSS